MSCKVLFVGLGSAGQRHLRNLLRILGDDIEIAAYRYHKSERVFGEDMQIIKNETLSTTYSIREFEEYEEALKAKPDIVIIANPNNMHIPYAIEAVKMDCDVFIEKPLGTDLAQIKELQRISKEKKAICKVGFQYRYHPCIQLAKQYLDEKKIGKIVSVYAQVGERLSKMHRYEDYRNMPEGKRNLGGGVVFCQIHELDYLLWFFGMPYSVCSVGGNLGGFDIDVEDVAVTMMRYGKTGEDFSVFLHQDFLQYPPSRICRIVGTKGKIEIDLLKGNFCFDQYEAEEHEEKKFNDFNRNDMFLEEMAEFLECVESRRTPVSDIWEASLRTQVGEAMLISLKERKEICVDGIF